MATPKIHGKPWTSQNIQILKKLANENTPTRVICLKLGRTEDAIYSEATKPSISLSRTNNQSSYDRK